MTDADLRKLCERATGGPWRIGHMSDDCGEADIVAPDHTDEDENFIADVSGFTSGSAEQSKANARYIAAVDPQTVLGLLDENKRLRELLSDLCDKIEYAGWHKSETAEARAALKEQPDV